VDVLDNITFVEQAYNVSLFSYSKANEIFFKSKKSWESSVTKVLEEMFANKELHSELIALNNDIK